MSKIHDINLYPVLSMIPSVYLEKYEFDKCLLYDANQSVIVWNSRQHRVFSFRLNICQSKLQPNDPLAWSEFTELAGKPIKKIITNRYGSIVYALTTGGDLYGWGINEHNQFRFDDRIVDRPILIDKQIIDFDCSIRKLISVNHQGNLMIQDWSQESMSFYNFPIKSSISVKMIACGPNKCFLIYYEDGHLRYGRIPKNSSEELIIGSVNEMFADLKKIIMSHRITLLLDDDGKLFQFNLLGVRYLKTSIIHLIPNIKIENIYHSYEQSRINECFFLMDKESSNFYLMDEKFCLQKVFRSSVPDVAYLFTKGFLYEALELPKECLELKTLNNLAEFNRRIFSHDSSKHFINIQGMESYERFDKYIRIERNLFEQYSDNLKKRTQGIDCCKWMNYSFAALYYYMRYLKTQKLLFEPCVRKELERMSVDFQTSRLMFTSSDVESISYRLPIVVENMIALNNADFEFQTAENQEFLESNSKPIEKLNFSSHSFYSKINEHSKNKKYRFN
ncbi:uncharacterized protein LOC142598222 [Dermatophagoides farinae]|uniref:uncharacterized protein LOC142598222 n=1 Tax=Dermatophagoides farinae TaxID=6954 RepID=UPI003F642D01